MNCQADQQSWLESAQNCVLQVIRPCIGWMHRQRQVHPVPSSPFADSQFIQLSLHRKIRVVHIDASKHNSNGWYANGTGIETMGHTSDQGHNSSKHRNSELSSEEYWFTRWNRPLRILDPCSCSFRKSWRNSLGDSRLILNQTHEETNYRTSQMLDSGMFCEKYVDQEDKMPSRRHKLLRIETYVEEVLQEVWSEVFLCLSQIEHSVKDPSQLKMKDLPHCINMQHNSGLKLDNVCRMRGESVGNYEFINDFNCQTLISFNETENNCHIVETVNNNPQGTNKQQSVSRSLKSVGCVNPTFLGSSTNPDLLEHRVVCHSPTEDCDTSSQRKRVPGFDGQDTKYFDDFDSGLNMVPPESLNHRTNDVGYLKTDERFSAGQPACAMENTQTECFTASPDGIRLTEEQARVPAGSHFNDKIIETKEIAQTDNQSTSTSVDAHKSEESGFADVRKSQKSSTQQRKSRQCYHTRNLRRVKPLLYFLHGVGCSADLWSALLRHFTAAGYEVLAPDMLGHGYSAAPDNASAYRFHRLLKDSIDIFDRFVEENRKCVVIGHAYGPQQVSHVVLISGGGPAPLAPRTADSLPPSVSPCLLACMKPLLMCGFRRNILYAPCGKHIESCPSMSRGMPHYVLHHVAQGQDWPEGDATFYRRILAPTLLVHGLQDPYVTLVQECEMERTIPRSFLELIPDAGHLSMVEAPVHLSHMIHCFIDWWSR
ncbi:uncharacterized protein LOC110827837 isoform X2 [Zootermopsis nevadensis]|uniref:uncharacterized protein LOC110827837 isoform X2 n=1 Tax=Zootermopsis nevadensis TaxID=136037 RepID=UPI000B8E2C0F|nr:uncharacterized protein LOC110827837 isoform X2 [Zootermopsis nevadensis]